MITGVKGLYLVGWPPAAISYFMPGGVLSWVLTCLGFWGILWACDGCLRQSLILCNFAFLKGF